mmetsp:Transcript_21115/g.36233  ORF Transcript_21115/g.36233 Transcript_21115/m.36233 type:complete len:124 (-) Transcript_21115:66-437(-)
MDNTTLQVLNISSNRIRKEGAIGIAKLLSNENSRIHTLHSEKNGLQDDDLSIICHSLKTNTVLQNIYLDDNSIQTKGAQYISETILMNNSIRVISLKSNPIPLDGKQTLEEACARNSKVLCSY